MCVCDEVEVEEGSGVCVMKRREVVCVCVMK